ncbi:MAG TPA: hypothetical protein VND92_06825 [Vicinamibacterales bacterium]|nr:hypothetical protein [Vicinamibacterales bacterium]
MDTGLRSPLVDFFRRGEVARDVRLLAAQGALAPRALEQLVLLVLLVDDADPVICGAAAETLGRIPSEALSAFLARPEVPEGLRTFFAARGVLPAAVPLADAESPLVEVDDGAAIPDGPPAPGDEGGDSRLSAAQRIAGMTALQKMNAALKGSREDRTILVRDPSRMVAMAVLSSPRVGEDEIESFARMATVSEDVLRAIAANRAWMRNYGVVQGLARNPKTPVAVSLNLLVRLNDRDLNAVSVDRNVPDPVRVAARKKVINATSRH